MARRTVKAKDLDPETDVSVGEDNSEVAPPGAEHYEVWEGSVYSEGKRDWPPRRRVRAWLGKDSARVYALAFTRAEADRAAKKEKPVSKYYVVVRVKMTRELV